MKKKSKKISSPTLPLPQSPWWAWASYTLLIVIIFGLTYNLITDNDTWWQIKLGEWMVKNRQVYTTEVFSHIAQGKIYIAYQWLSQVLFYLIAGTNGVGLGLFKMLIIGGTYGATLYYFIRRYGAKQWSILIFGVLAYLIAYRTQERPHLFEIVFTSFLLIIIDRWNDSQQNKVLLFFLPLQILWANMHGSFLLGPFLVGIWGACRLPKKDSRKSGIMLMAFSLLLILSSMINPFGYKLIEKSLIMFFTHDYMRQHINEWKSVFHYPLAYWFMAWCLWIVSTALAMFKKKEQTSLSDWATLALATYFPISGVRYVTLSTLLALPLLLKYSSQIFPTPVNFKRASLILLPVTLFISFFGFAEGAWVFRARGLGFNYQQVPLDIFQHIKSHQLKGVLLTHYNDSSYTIYYLYPEVLTMLDSRTELYGKELFEEHQNAYATDIGFNFYVQKYNVNLILTRIEHGPLRNFLFNHPDWKLEKVGLNFDLFSKVTSTNPKNDYPRIPNLASTSLSEDQRYCLFVDFYGLCPLEPKCQGQCGRTINQFADALQLSDPLCLRFTQACLNQKFACGNCRSLCVDHQQVIDRINRELPVTLPAVPSCR